MPSEKPKATASAVLQSGEMVEMVYRPKRHETAFLVFDGKDVREEEKLAMDAGPPLVPYSPENNLLVHQVVALPSDVGEYENEEKLAAEVRAFIHAYVDIAEPFEEIASYYVLFSWIYDAFNELPYLRVIGDYGSGKSRFLLAVGSLCYKGIFASGASTVSPLFRILDAFQGTLIVDEGDWRVTDEKAEVVKILNNGNARGFPVLRTDVLPTKELNPRAYQVFGPKIVATRSLFEDRALESRCISQEMTGKVRADIPLNLPSAFAREALALRNKLLSFRFRNRLKVRNLEELVDRTLEPRVAQVFAPLAATMESREARESLAHLARSYSHTARLDRSMALEARVLEVVQELRAEKVPLALSAIAERFGERHGDEYDRKVTPRWIGSVLRRRLFLHPEKSHGNFVIPVSEYPKLDSLCERYGVAISSEPPQSP